MHTLNKIVDMFEVRLEPSLFENTERYLLKFTMPVYGFGRIMVDNPKMLVSILNQVTDSYIKDYINPPLCLTSYPPQYSHDNVGKARFVLNEENNTIDLTGEIQRDILFFNYENNMTPCMYLRRNKKGKLQLRVEKSVVAEDEDKFIFPKFISIYCKTRDGIIGIGNDLVMSLPEDMRNFKNITMGCPVIMGRKTYESLGMPGGLPGRVNIILTKDEEYANCVMDKHCLIAYTSKQQLFDHIMQGWYSFFDKFYIIGGATIYKLFEDDISEEIVTTLDIDESDIENLENHQSEIVRYEFKDKSSNYDISKTDTHISSHINDIRTRWALREGFNIVRGTISHIKYNKRKEDTL